MSDLSNLGDLSCLGDLSYIGNRSNLGDLSDLNDLRAILAILVILWYLQASNAFAYSKPPALETCSGSSRCLIGVNAEYLQYKGTCHDSQTDPLDALPFLGHNLIFIYPQKYVLVIIHYLPCQSFHSSS